MKRILILGGYGFMGKHLNKVFADSNYEIFNESRKSNCDILNLSQLRIVLKEINPDIIIFAAAHVGSVNYVSEKAGDVINDNTQMYLNLYKTVLEVNKKIIILNPLANCSFPGIIDIQHEELWWEGKIHESVEAYGMTQKMAFIISECYKKQYGIKTINLILPGCYGEDDHVDEEKTHAMNGIIMRMIRAKKNKDKEFVVWGSGKPIREWVYMTDVAKVFKKIIDNETFDLPNLINIGQEKGISISDIAFSVKKILDYDVEIIYDTSKQDGAPIKILGSKLFKIHFPNFKFTDHKIAMKNTIKYYTSLT